LGAGAADEDEQDEEEEEEEDAAAAISDGVPTCCIFPHRGVSVRTGSACRSLWSSRAERDDDDEAPFPWRPPARFRRRDGGSSSVCPGVRRVWWWWWWTPRRTASSREKEEADEDEDEDVVVVVVVPVPAADGGRLSLGRRPGAGWMAKPPIDARARRPAARCPTTTRRRDGAAEARRGAGAGAGGR